MKFIIDPTNKTIEVEGSGNLSQVIQQLTLLIPEDRWHEWMIDFDTPSGQQVQTIPMPFQPGDYSPFHVPHFPRPWDYGRQTAPYDPRNPNIMYTTSDTVNIDLTGNGTFSVSNTNGEYSTDVTIYNKNCLETLTGNG